MNSIISHHSNTIFTPVAELVVDFSMGDIFKYFIFYFFIYII
jgi:hypothetical protein